MQNSIRDYFHLMRVGTSIADPTVPFDNDFHLLGLDETESDQQIAQKAKALAAIRSNEVEKRGMANAGKRLDILLRDKINQAGARFDGSPDKVREHRNELQRDRDRRLIEFAKDLCDSGKWTAQQGTDMLEILAYRIGITPDRVARAVSDAMQTTGQWSAVPGGSRLAPPPPPPTPPLRVSNESVSVGSLKVPLWGLIPAIGLALGVINGWAGLAFGLAFLLLALGRANAERNLNPRAPTGNHLKWGLINAGVASVPLVVLLIFHPGATASSSKWAGDWETDWGKMTFRAGSSQVTAQYETRGGSGKAELKPSAARQLDGSWCLGTCTPPNGTGRLRLVLDENERTFKGWFTYGLDSPIQAGDDAENQISGRRKATK
ncbi:MAG: hypothetical protein NTW28_06615 [Candidatus Solibacter sp.]|nr:hypothetical protein [Candidatus Solibacter sp.]